MFPYTIRYLKNTIEMRTIFHNLTAYIWIGAAPEKLIHSAYIKQFIMLSKHDFYWTRDLSKLLFRIAGVRALAILTLYV